MARVTLTRSQIKDGKVTEFTQLLLNIAADGVLEYEEMLSLSEWLNTNKGLPVPAISFLFGIMLRISNSGSIKPSNVYDLQLAIERILPKEFRLKVKEKRQAAYYSQPASDAQLSLLRQVTGKEPPATLTRLKASEMLDKVFSGPSNRQIMLLRFWDRLDLLNASREDVSQWIDAFFDEEPMRWEAWQIFKDEVGDDGGQNDPSIVSIGIGSQYLLKAAKA